MPKPRRPRDVPLARQLRQAMSLPEVLLWRLLRTQTDVKIRRQHPIGPYVLDFYCDEARIGFEIDGQSHDRGDRPARDAKRDAWLVQQGIEVMRIAAAEVLRSPEAMAEAIVMRCRR